MQSLNQPLSEYWTLSVYFYSHAFTWTCDSSLE